MRRAMGSERAGPVVVGGVRPYFASGKLKAPNPGLILGDALAQPYLDRDRSQVRSTSAIRAASESPKA